MWQWNKGTIQGRSFRLITSVVIKILIEESISEYRRYLNKLVIGEQGTDTVRNRQGLYKK